MIAWSRGSSKLDAEPEQRLSPDFDAFVRALEVDRAPAKELAYFAAPFSSNGNGNGRGHRGKETVQPVEFLILDFDHLTPESEPDLLDWLKSFKGAAWRTHSSTEKAPRRCALLQLSRAATRHECISVNQVVARDVHEALGLVLDTAQFKPEQPRYMPPVGVTFAHFWGEPIDVDLYLTLVPPPEHRETPAPAGPHQILEGGRNAALTALAGKLRRIGLDAPELLGALRECNRQRCRPPLSDADVATIARSVARYEPAVEQRAPNRTPECAEFSGKWPTELVPHLSGLYLVKGLLPTRAVAQMYGEPNCGKSAVMLDLCCHLASGRAYAAGRTRPAPVAYLALENPLSIENRVVAWCSHYQIARDRLRLFTAQGALNLLNSVSVEGLIGFLQAQTDIVFELVVLDTQARATPGANENASEHVSLMITHVDRIRDALGCTVCLVHHAGKDTTKGARGHSSQLGAVDTAIEVADRQMILRKGRDMVSGRSIPFRLVPIGLGNDEDGDPVTAVVADLQIDAQPPSVKRTYFVGFPGIAWAAFTALIAKGEARSAPRGHSTIPAGMAYLQVEQWQTEFVRALGNDTPGRERKAFWDAKTALLKAGAIRIHDGLVWRTAAKAEDE